MPWTMVSIILDVISNAGKSGSFLNDTVTKLIDTVSAILKRGEPTEAALKALKEEIEKMVALGRDPTPEEWAAMRKRSDAAHERIQNG